MAHAKTSKQLRIAHQCQLAGGNSHHSQNNKEGERQKLIQTLFCTLINTQAILNTSQIFACHMLCLFALIVDVVFAHM